MISTKDSSILALDGETGNTLSASMVHPKKPSRALFMQILCKIILTWSILFLEIDLFLSLCTMHTFQLLRLPFIDEVEEESYWTPFFWSSADGQDSSTRGSGIPNDLELGKGSNPGVDSVPKQSLVLLCSEKAAYIFSFVHAVQVAINCRHPIEPSFLCYMRLSLLLFFLLRESRRFFTRRSFTRHVVGHQPSTVKQMLASCLFFPLGKLK